MSKRKFEEKIMKKLWMRNRREQKEWQWKKKDQGKTFLKRKTF